jgi:tetratricopeptide (TPR) repeat protein
MLVVPVAAFVLAASAPRSAHAADDAPAPAATSADARAADLFEQSARAYREGRFRDAVALLREVQRVKPAPVLDYNLARAYEALGDGPAAVAAYERYLAEDSSAPDRAGIEAKVAVLRQQIAERETLRRRRAEEADRPRAGQGGGGAPVLPLAVTGIGVVTLGAGVVVGVLARGRHDDAVAETQQARAADEQTQAKHLATAATIALVAGGVVTAVGVAWTVLASTSRSGGGSGSGASARLELRPGGVACAGTF